MGKQKIPPEGGHMGLKRSNPPQIALIYCGEVRCVYNRFSKKAGVL